jgi:fibronectin-binding autotransporter adhesin
MLALHRPSTIFKSLVAAAALGLSWTAVAGATVSQTTAALLPTALHANTTSIVDINGNYLDGATVTTTSPEIISIGTVTEELNASQVAYLAVPITVGTFTGSAPTSANVTITGSGNPVVDSLTIDPDPTITGGPYYAAPSSTNLEVNVTGTYISATGVTVSSSDSDFAANVVSTTSGTADLLVTTTAAAVDGTSSTITLTNPDGSSTSFVLHGGAPISKPTMALSPTILHTGTNSTLTITGGPFTAGAVVTTTSAYIITPGVPTIVSSSEITVPITVGSLTGTTGVSANVTVTNPDSGTISGSLTIETSPTVTGTYYVTPKSTNIGVTVSGTNLSTTGVTASSSNPAFSIVVVSTTATSATLLASTTAAAGATTKITLTNPDGSSATFPLDAGSAPVVVSKPSVGLSPAALHAGAASTLTVTGGPFVTGAVVATTSPELLTLGPTTFVSSSELTVTATVLAVTGTATTTAIITVTNPDTGEGSASLSIYPDPAITGTYTVPASSTNYELNVTGTELSAGLKVTSSSTDFSVAVVTSTATSISLLVTTTAAAAGETSTITVTNPDTSSTTFVLHGGPASSTSSTTTTTVPKGSTTTTTLPKTKATAITVSGFEAKSLQLTGLSREQISYFALKIPIKDKVTIHGYASTLAVAKKLAKEAGACLRGVSPKLKVVYGYTVTKAARKVVVSFVA